MIIEAEDMTKTPTGHIAEMLNDIIVGKTVAKVEADSHGWVSLQLRLEKDGSTGFLRIWVGKGEAPAYCNNLELCCPCGVCELHDFPNVDVDEEERE